MDLPLTLAAVGRYRPPSPHHFVTTAVVALWPGPYGNWQKAKRSGPPCGVLVELQRRMRQQTLLQQAHTSERLRNIAGQAGSKKRCFCTPKEKKVLQEEEDTKETQ